jgi:hypothetical protein
MKHSMDSNHFFGTVIKPEVACHNPYSKNEMEMRLVHNRKLFKNSKYCRLENRESQHLLWMKKSNSDGINTSFMMINVVDCASVSNLKTAPHENEYVNNNGLQSTNVQATYVSKEMLTGVHVSWPGSVDDSGTGKNSDVRVKMTEVVDVLVAQNSG